MSDRESFSSYVRGFLIENRLFFEKGPNKGKPSLGRITAKVIDELYDRYSEKAQAWEKAQRAAKRAPRVPKEAERIPPTEEEVREHCRLLGYTFSVAGFFGHYSSNGWKVGKNAMVSWKGACRTFQGDAPRRAGSNGAPVSVYAEPSWDWRAAVNIKWPIENYPGRTRYELGEWAEIDPAYRKMILADGPPK